MGRYYDRILRYFYSQRFPDRGFGRGEYRRNRIHVYGSILLWIRDPSVQKVSRGRFRPSDFPFYRLTSAALASGLYTGIASPSSIPLLFAPERLGSLVILGALGSGAAYLLYYFLVQKGSPEFASLVTYIVPVSAIAWGYFLLGEHIKPGMAVGLAVIFLGIYISSYKVKRVKKQDLAA